MIVLFSPFVPEPCPSGPATFRLEDATKSPRQIDIDGVSHRGIYELDGDRRKLCVGEKDGRPTEFTTPPGTDHSARVLERVK